MGSLRVLRRSDITICGNSSILGDLTRLVQVARRRFTDFVPASAHPIMHANHFGLPNHKHPLTFAPHLQPLPQAIGSTRAPVQQWCNAE